MKKMIILIMIICIMLCGCSNNEPQPIDTTNVPTDTITTTPTESTTTVESETDQTSNKSESECQICGEKTLCNVYSKDKWNNDLGMYIKKTYYLCDDCYLKVLKNETVCDNYNAIVEAANVACTNENVISEISKFGKTQIIINSDGVSLKNGGENLLKALQSAIPDLLNITTPEEYEIEIDCSNGWCNVKKIKSPSNILNVLVD